VAAKTEEVQEVIDMLRIAVAAPRRQRPDVRKYIHKREEQVVKVCMNNGQQHCRAMEKLKVTKWRVHSQVQGTGRQGMHEQW